MTMKITVRTRGRPAKPIERRRANTKRRQDRPLTAAQELFVNRYLVTMCATAAYRASYPKANYSTARKEASKLIADPRIARQIKLLTAELCARYRHSAKRTLDEVAALAFANIRDVLGEDGSVLPPQDIPRPVMAAVKKFESDDVYGPVKEGEDKPSVVGRTVKVELHDKVQPLRLLGQHYNLFTERLEFNPGKGFAAALAAARQRVIDGLAERVD